MARIALINARNSDFLDVLSDLSIQYDIKNIQDLEEENLSEYDALMMLAEDYQFPNILSSHALENLHKWLKSGKGLYCEYTYLNSAGDMQMLEKMPKGRLYVRNVFHPATEAFEYLDILDPRECRFIPIDYENSEILLSLGKFTGTHKVLNFINDKKYPGLVAMVPESTNVIYAAFPLSRYVSKYFSPHFKWNLLAKGIVRAILNRKIDEGLNIKSRNRFAPGYSKNTVIEDRKSVYFNTVCRAMDWFIKSGMLLPDNQGRLDLSNGIYSRPDIHGNPISASEKKEGSNVEVSYLFKLYGRIIGNPMYEQLGKRIFKKISHNDYPVLDKINSEYEFWYYGFGDGFNVRHFEQIPTINHDVPFGAYIWAYAVTEDPLYLKIADKGLKALIKKIDEGNFSPLLISKTTEIAYIMQPLSLLYFYTGKEEYKSELRKCIEYLICHQDSSGGIEEADNPNKDAYDCKDLAVCHEDGECISDQMYTCSFAVMNLFLAWKATGDEVYLNIFHKLADYLVKIQIDSPNSLYDGAWMRGFDFKNWEYYGSNAEDESGPYHIDPVKNVAQICIAFLMYLSDDPLFMEKPNL